MINIRNTAFLLTAAILVIMTFPGAVIATEPDYPVAGIDPHARPVGAPELAPLQKTNDWYKSAVTGVEEPYPASLEFLEAQGRWYTPFTKPGMTAPYDIRHWHTKTHNP